MVECQGWRRFMYDADDVERVTEDERFGEDKQWFML